MTELTRRRRNTDGRFESWRVYSGDVAVGLIEERSGVPLHADQWQWSCGFYPGCDKRTQQTIGTAASFEEARRAFQQAWEKLEPHVTPAMRAEWLEHQAFTAWKARMRDERCKMPTQNPDGRSRCFCGAEITTENADAHIRAAHMA